MDATILGGYERVRRVAQGSSLEEECYMFAGAEKYGLSCDGCGHKRICEELENELSQR